MELIRWTARLRSALNNLAVNFEPDYGHPFSSADNFITDADEWTPSRATGELPQCLSDFYTHIGEVSLPDVYIGYFIFPAELLATSVVRGVPTRVATPALAAEVSTFGADGGGEYFAVRRSDESIWFLPTGAVEDGVYVGGFDRPRQIAEDLDGFLTSLLGVVEEFTLTGDTRGVGSYRQDEGQALVGDPGL